MKKKILLLSVVVSAVTFLVVGSKLPICNSECFVTLSKEEIETLASCEASGINLENCIAKYGHKCYSIGSEFVANNCEKILVSA